MRLPFDYSFFEALHDGVYVVNKDREILLWNKGAERITGFALEEVKGKHCGDKILCHIDANGTQLCTAICPLLKSIHTGTKQTVQAYLHHKSGHRVSVSITTIPFHDENGDITGAIEIFNNKNEQLFDVEKIRELAKLSYTDPATGLYNPRYMENKILKILQTIELNDPLGLLLIQLLPEENANKELNKILHRDFIHLIAQTLLPLNDQRTVCGRLEDDEFLLISEGYEKGQLLLMINKLNNLLKNSFITVESTGYTPKIVCGGIIQTRQETYRSLYLRLKSRVEEAKKSGPFSFRVE